MFELNTEQLNEDELMANQKKGITKQGWLHKAPDYEVTNFSAKVFSFDNIMFDRSVPSYTNF